MESLCRAGHANKLHHFCLGDRGQWHAICQRQEMNEAHLLCTGRFGRQSSEAAVAKRKAAEMQGPPAPRALLELEGSGQGEGTWGASPSGRECRPRDSEKEPGDIAALCSPAPQGRGKENPRVHSSCKESTRTRRVRAPAVGAACRHTCTATEAGSAAPRAPATHGSHLTSNLGGSTPSVSVPASRGRRRLLMRRRAAAQRR